MVPAVIKMTRWQVMFKARAKLDDCIDLMSKITKGKDIHFMFGLGHFSESLILLLREKYIQEM